MTSRIVLFGGPSIAADDARSLAPGIDVRPPAAHGDLYRAARDGASTIVLVDGVFDWVRSVWHKEILWALAHGVRVLGASSMGALRAAECAPFGMEPHGVVAADYAGGRRTSDGDVAQAHGTAADGWRPLSEALVNVDATIDAAAAAGVVPARAASALRLAARGIFYADRVWPEVLSLADLSPGDRRRFTAWLPDGYVDRKCLDARLAVLAAASPPPPPPAAPPFAFARTALWQRAADAIDRPARVAVATVDLRTLD